MSAKTTTGPFLTSDDGKKIIGVVNPDGSENNLYTDNANRLDKGQLVGRITSRRLPYLSDGILATYKANIIASGDTISDWTIRQIRDSLERLVRGSAFTQGKIKELWVPNGTSATTGALVKLISHSTAGTSMTAINLVAGDYADATGITGNGTNKGLNTGFNPTTAGVTTDSWGFGIYALNTTASGALGGTVSNNNSYISFTDSSSKINNIGLTTTPQYPRFASVQANTTVIEGSYGGHIAQTAAYAAATLPNVNLALLTSNSGNWSTQAVCGYAAWSPALTAEEKTELAIFFDSVSMALSRKGFKDAICAMGDSNTRGLGLGSITTERWSALLAARLGLADSNAGSDNTTMSNRTNGGETGNWVISRKVSNSQRLAGGINIVSLGTNDDQYRVSEADFETDYETWLNYQWLAGFDMSQFILCSPIAATGGLCRRATQIAFTAIIKKLALKYGCGFHDDFAITDGVRGIWQVDNLHLNAAGHILKANSLAAYIGRSYSATSAVRPAIWL